MRSKLITDALKQIPNRYLLMGLASKATRAFHKPHARIADTANQVLLQLAINGQCGSLDASANGPVVEIPRFVLDPARALDRHEECA